MATCCFPFEESISRGSITAATRLGYGSCTAPKGAANGGAVSTAAAAITGHGPAIHLKTLNSNVKGKTKFYIIA